MLLKRSPSRTDIITIVRCFVVVIVLPLTFCGLASVFLLSPNITFEQPCAKKWRETAVMCSNFLKVHKSNYFIVKDNGKVYHELTNLLPTLAGVQFGIF